MVQIAAIYLDGMVAASLPLKREKNNLALQGPVRRSALTPGYEARSACHFWATAFSASAALF